MSSSTERIIVGLIGKPFGLDGHVTVRVESDDDDRFAIGSVFPGPDETELVVDDVRDAERGVVVRFKGHTTRARAEELRGHVLTISVDQRRDLDEDEFWPDELVGMIVVDENGERIGTVSSVVEGPAQERLVVRAAAGFDVEIPFVAAIVIDVDLDDRTVTIKAMPGLIEQ